MMETDIWTITYFKACMHCGTETVVSPEPHCDACYACICDECWSKESIRDEHRYGQCAGASMPWD